MVTGGQLIASALRDPMQSIGWTPRAARWFTRAIAPGYTGVVVASPASEHAAPGTAYVALFVHLRREDVEPVVKELTGSTYQDGGYRSATATTSIGYLMPEPTWRTWWVAPHTAGAVAAELAALTQEHAEPYLERLAADPDVLLDAVKSSPSMAQATGPCRVAVLLAGLGRPEEARAFAHQAVAALGSRTDPAAHELRQVVVRLDAWLDQLAS